MKAMKQGRGSPIRNIVTVTLPVGAILFAGVYWLGRSHWLALAVAGVFVVASIWSNARFFSAARQRRKSGFDQPTVEVMEVEAT